jgi:threonine/homoserine/homoserine lactone efflux protein
MSYAENLWLFFLLLFGIISVPGMDMLFVLANTLTGGRKVGLAATAGIMLGGIAHTACGAFGVALVFQAAPWLYKILLFSGLAYMAWIGVTLMTSSIRIGDISAAPKRSPWAAFRQGFFTCILNPKAYVFVITVYPQFVRPQYGALWAQAVVMGLLTIATQLFIYGGLAIAAARSAGLIARNPDMTVLVGRSCGILFLLVASWIGWESL